MSAILSSSVDLVKVEAVISGLSGTGIIFIIVAGSQRYVVPISGPDDCHTYKIAPPFILPIVIDTELYPVSKVTCQVLCPVASPVLRMSKPFKVNLKPPPKS